MTILIAKKTAAKEALTAPYLMISLNSPRTLRILNLV